MSKISCYLTVPNNHSGSKKIRKSKDDYKKQEQNIAPKAIHNSNNNNSTNNNHINNMLGLSFPKFNINRINIQNSKVADASKKTKFNIATNKNNFEQFFNVGNNKNNSISKKCLTRKCVTYNNGVTRNNVTYKNKVTCKSDMKRNDVYDEYSDEESDYDSDSDSEELNFSLIDHALFVPRIVSALPKRYFSVVGAQAVFTCVTTVLFPVECQWFLNGKLVDRSHSHGRMYTRDRGKTLVILSLCEEDHGNLVMMAFNAFGKARTTCRLKVKDLSGYDSDDYHKGSVDSVALTSSRIVANEDDVFDKQEQGESDDSGISSQTTNDDSRSGATSELSSLPVKSIVNGCDKTILSLKKHVVVSDDDCSTASFVGKEFSTSSTLLSKSFQYIDGNSSKKINDIKDIGNNETKNIDFTCSTAINKDFEIIDDDSVSVNNKDGTKHNSNKLLHAKFCQDSTNGQMSRSY